MKSDGNGRQAGQEERKLEIEILHLIEGAKKAEGIAVVIDVFRAFSMECYLYAFGAREVRPVGSIGETFAWREKDPECILAGERHGRRIEGCDLGNSPSAVTPAAVRGKRVIHTTSAGTQGIVNAGGAEEILTGSFVNAKATAEYILAKQPRRVSLVAMGREGLEETEEDELCAAYLKSLLTGAEMPDIEKLYQEYSAEEDPEVIILGVAAPGHGGEEDIEGITSFLEENGYTYPVVMDTDGAQLRAYAISAYPTTFMIDKDGNLFGYVAGSLPESTMRDIIDQTLSAGA